MYDAETDILLIELSREKPVYAEQCEDIITHYLKTNKPVEIEILNARANALDLLAAVLKQKTMVRVR